jgi:hypothetical protein
MTPMPCSLFGVKPILLKKYGKPFKPNKLLLTMANTDEKIYDRFNP